jgi:STAS domain
MLKEVVEDLTRAGVEVAMADVKGPVRAMLDRTGLSQQIGAARCFRRWSRRLPKSRMDIHFFDAHKTKMK